MEDGLRIRGVLDKGHIQLLEWMGDDYSITNAARLSTNKTSTNLDRDTRLIFRLMKDRHTSPFEMVEFKFLVKCPIFVARQWFRHRTGNYNEWSGRYSEITEEYYVPDLSRMQAQHSTNKQMSGENLSEESAVEAQRLIGVSSKLSYLEYRNLLDLGLSREVARMILPQNMYTKFIFKIDLHNLLNFIRLRSAPDAQWEIQQYSNAIIDLIDPIVPITLQAFREYMVVYPNAENA